MKGDHIYEINNEPQAPGYYSINWNVDGCPSGIYFAIITSEYVNTH